MKRKEEKADLAALESNKELRLCAVCFYVLPADAEKCPDCGAPVDDAARISGGDAEIYPELARANLFRMRGEYRKAEDVCRAILRRFPNNATAAGLLGDICVEENQLEDGARWYELAIDSSPDSDSDKRKLESVQRRIKEREALNTAEQLGLPSTKPKAGLFALLILGFIVAVGIAAYLLGKTNTEAKLRKPGSTVNVPFEAGGDPNANVNVQSEPTNNPDQPVSSEPITTGNALLDALKTKTGEGARLIDAWQDPRTKTVYLTMRFEESDNERFMSANMAKAALEHVTDAPRAKIRGNKKGVEAYFADAERAAIAAADPKLAESDPTAYANSILTNEFPPTTPAATGDSAGPNTTTGGDADPPNTTGTGGEPGDSSTGH